MKVPKNASELKLHLRRRITGAAFTLHSLAWITGGVIFGAFGSILIARSVPVQIGTPIALLVTLAGLLAGLWMNQASLGFLLPFLYSGERVERGTLGEAFRSLCPQFADDTPELFLVDGSPLGATVFVAGFAPFRPRVFIERSLVHSLSASDWEPIFAHELAHVRLGHLRERSLFIFRTLFLCTLFSTAALLGLSWMGLGQGLPFAAVLSAVIPVLVCQFGGRILVERQEGEADLLASLVIPDGKRKLSETLRKMTELQGTGSMPFSTVERIRKLA